MARVRDRRAGNAWVVATGVAQWFESHARGAERSTWLEWTGRLGLAARGVVYCVAAAIAVQISMGGGGRADRQGALKSIADEPLGHAFLVVLAAGFASYAVWRFAKAAVGSGEGTGKERGASGVAARLTDVGRGLIYVVFLVTTVRLLVSGKEGAGGDQEAKTWSARLMAHSAGQWIVLAAGAVVVIVGVVLVARAFAEKFEEHLELACMRGWQRTWLPRLGIVGYAARGGVAVLVGAFVIQAAATFDPQKAVGVDGALKRLAGEPYGPALLCVVALGLLAFGAFSFVEARWRKILED